MQKNLEFQTKQMTPVARYHFKEIIVESPNAGWTACFSATTSGGETRSTAESAQASMASSWEYTYNYIYILYYNMICYNT